MVLYRNRFPRARVTHLLSDWPAENSRIVRGVVRVENVGNVMIHLGSIQGVLTQILPLPSDVKAALARGGNALDRGATEIVWETLHDMSKNFGKENCEVEPGEARQQPAAEAIHQGRGHGSRSFHACVRDFQRSKPRAARSGPGAAVSFGLTPARTRRTAAAREPRVRQGGREGSTSVLRRVFDRVVRPLSRARARRARIRRGLTWRFAAFSSRTPLPRPSACGRRV